MGKKIAYRIHFSFYKNANFDIRFIMRVNLDYRTENNIEFSIRF